MRQSIIGRYGYKPWRETIISLCVMVGVVNELHMNIISLYLYSPSTLHTGSSPPDLCSIKQYSTLTLHSTLLATQNHFDTKA